LVGPAHSLPVEISIYPARKYIEWRSGAKEPLSKVQF
jgi:hypothetical protein